MPIWIEGTKRMRTGGLVKKMQWGTEHIKRSPCITDLNKIKVYHDTTKWVKNIWNKFIRMSNMMQYSGGNLVKYECEMTIIELVAICFKKVL